MVVWALLVCAIYSITGKNVYLQTVLLAVATYLMVLLNNTFSLIRVFSRTVSSSFLMFSCLMIWLLDSTQGALFQILFILHYLFLLACYQQRDNAGFAYFAFACLSLCSLFMPKIILLAPFTIICLLTFLMCGSRKNLVASLLGLLTPYWCWLAWALQQAGDMQSLTDHLLQMVSFTMPHPEQLFTTYHAIPLCILIISSIAAIFHFLYTYSADKFKTKMLYGIFIMMMACDAVMLICIPDQHDFIFRMMIVNASPLIGHMLTFATSRLSTIIFCVVAPLLAILTLVMIWIF